MKFHGPLIRSGSLTKLRDYLVCVALRHPDSFRATTRALNYDKDVLFIMACMCGAER